MPTAGIKTLFVDPARCIGCRACEAACRECDSHKGESMVMVDFIDRGLSVATQPTVCMHCEDPVAPCAQVCPVMAIQITPDGVVQQADPSRCIACRNCVYACPFGVPKLDIEARLMKKCNLCYDRTAEGLSRGARKRAQHRHCGTARTRSSRSSATVGR
jgi:Fe-S-cluster-containing dehydrogenase component